MDKYDRLNDLAQDLTDIQSDLDVIADVVDGLRTQLRDLGHKIHNAVGELDNVILADEEVASSVE